MTDQPQPRIPTQFREPDPSPARDTFGPRASFPRPAEPQHDRPDEDAPERDGEAAAAVPAAAPPPPDTAPRTPVAAGTYAVYDDGDGGVVLVIGTREGETHHKHIPAKLIRMGEMMMGGNSPLSMLFGGP